MMSLGFKLIKATTPEEFVANLFMFSKLGSVVLFLFVHPRLSIFYTLLCFVLWLILKQPKYSGPSKLVKRFRSNDEFFEDILGYEADEMVVGLKAEQHAEAERKRRAKGKKSKEAGQNFSDINSTLLVFTANWCETCTYTYSMWVKFANRFTTEKVKVVEVDTSRHE